MLKAVRLAARHSTSMDIFIVKCLITVYVGVILWLNYLHLICNAFICDPFYFKSKSLLKFFNMWDACSTLKLESCHWKLCAMIINTSPPPHTHTHTHKFRSCSQCLLPSVSLYRAVIIAAEMCVPPCMCTQLTLGSVRLQQQSHVCLHNAHVCLHKVNM